MDRIKVLVTGSGGLLSSQFKKLNAPLFEFSFLNEHELDITDENSVSKIKGRFDFIFNCAAYTDVDAAESNQEIALKINETGTKNLSNCVFDSKTKLIHVSTDMVFTGTKDSSFNEDEATNPVNFYGKSKALGEEAILKTAPNNSYILRTSWLYGTDEVNNHKGFVNKFLDWASKNPELKIVTDEVASPTYAKDLAIRMLFIAMNSESIKPGIFHVTNDGFCSRFELASEIKRILNLENKISEAKIADFNRPAKVSESSVLINNKLPKMRFWKDALFDYLVNRNI